MTFDLTCDVISDPEVNEINFLLLLSWDEFIGKRYVQIPAVISYWELSEALQLPSSPMDRILKKSYKHASTKQNDANRLDTKFKQFKRCKSVLICVKIITSIAPFGRRTSERESDPCTRRRVRGHFQLACARHPTSRSLAVCQIWRQSTRPFLRSRSGTLHVRTCKLGPKLLLHDTLPTGA